MGSILRGSMRGMGKQSFMDAELAEYAKTHPHANIVYVSPTTDAALTAQTRLQKHGFFSVGDLALAPNGAQVWFDALDARPELRIEDPMKDVEVYDELSQLDPEAWESMLHLIRKRRGNSDAT